MAARPSLRATQLSDHEGPDIHEYPWHAILPICLTYSVMTMDLEVESLASGLRARYIKAT